MAEGGESSFATQAESLYAWYQSIRRPTFPRKGFIALQIIMQIGHQGTATVEEGKEASRRLSDLAEALDGGEVTLDKIPEEVSRILDVLVQSNPKSRVIMQATQIEIAVNLHQHTAPEEFNKMMEKLLRKVNPTMPHMQAEAISRILQEVLESPQEKGELLKRQILPLLDRE